MEKNLYKVASNLNSQLLANLQLQLMKSAADEKSGEEESGEKKKTDAAAFRQQRSHNRAVESATPIARLIAAGLIGGMIGGGEGAVTGIGLGLGAEYLGGAIGLTSASWKGGRSRAEQREYDKKSQARDILHWLVPGYGLHQLGRRNIRMQDAIEDLPEQES